MNSGIQRVVRNIVQSSAPGASPIAAIPVFYQEGHFYPVDGGIPYPGRKRLADLPWHQRLGRQAESLARESITTVRRCIKAVLPFRAVQRFVDAPRTEWGLSRIGLYPLMKLGLVDDEIPVVDVSATPPVQFSSGDTLVLLDSSWHVELWSAVRRCKAEGVTIAAAVYDLIPHLHSELCPEDVTTSFRRWLGQMINHADVVIAISRAVADDVRHHLPSMLKPGRAMPKVTYFHLGSELDGETVCDSTIRPQLRDMLTSHVPTYTYVSTVEPRKNHAYALDAFERLWASGVCANFVIVGRIGWQGDEFARRVHQHPQYNRQLFLWSDVDDYELATLYRQAHGLIFTSRAEGFGLPIVEGLQRGLPVFASDMPVFREIGQQGVHFVALDNPDHLAQALQAHIANGAPRLPEPINWLSWAQSTMAFFDHLERAKRRVPSKHIEIEALERQAA